MPVTSPQLQARHYPSGLNSAFCPQPTFAEYVLHCRQMIAEARSGCGLDNAEHVIEGNAPFELWPDSQFLQDKAKRYRCGILLTHGLSDSPYFMRHLAAFFREQGFAVKAILLPGHGTQPGDLLEVRWQEWSKAVAFGVAQLAAEVDELYLGGYSAGGALSVYQALLEQQVRGLFLFAPALKVAPKAAWANFHKCYSWLRPQAKWVNIMPDTDCYKYESFTKNAAAQMHQLTQVLKTQLENKRIAIPVFAVQSQDDVTVDADATVNFMRGAIHPGNKLIYYFSDIGNAPHGMAKDLLESLDCVLKDEHILSSSHTAIVLPREDEYYGVHGEYCNCLHYYRDEPEKFLSCIADRDGLSQGEITRKNLAQGMLRRLMYNPHYAAMKKSLSQFISRLAD